MFRFGFEVEGFFKRNGVIEVPPKSYTHDDFPGLVEVRNNGGGDIRDQLYLLKSKMDEYHDVDFSHHEHKFSPSDRSKIRSRHYEKGGVSINNIYGKSPKDLGSRTLASFQINLSLYRGQESSGNQRYGMFDFIPIIMSLDEEFSEEIKASGRQKGFYSVKDEFRLEYRSLPNSVSLIEPNKLIKRIKDCLT